MGRIVDYPEITTLSDGDYLIVDNAEGGTKKVSAQSVAGTVDPTPTEGSTNAVSSGGVWTSLNDISEEFDGLRTDAYDVYPKGSASSDIVQFETGADNVPLSDLTGYIYPMMSGSGMPSRTNIRTISGPDDINVYQRNKNLIEQIAYQADPETVYLGVQNSSNLTMFFKAGDYRITVNIVGGSTVEPYWAIGSTATHSEYMHLDNDTNVSIYVYDADGISASDIESFQVEVGTEATDYVEFEGDITNVVLPTDRGAIYSGRVALTAGKVYIDAVIYERNSSTMNNTEDKPGWAYTGLETYDVAISTFDDVIYWPNGDVRCTNVNVGSTYSVEAANEDYSLILPRDVYNMSQSQWISAGVDIQILVKLNTPIEIDIDPVEVRSLYGFNTYYCDSGETEVLYSIDLAAYIDDRSTDIQIDPTLTQSGQAADAKVVGDEISTRYFSPETTPGYWTESGGKGTASGTYQEVVTEWFTPLGDKIAFKLTYPEVHNTWICVLYVFGDGTKQRVVVKTGNGTDFSGVVAIPANVARLSLSYRTYGDCTFAISGIFAAEITEDDLQRFKCKYTPIESMELVETIVTSANSRANWSSAILDGFYAVIPEMASEDYTYTLILDPTSVYYLFNRRFSQVLYIKNAKLGIYISPSAYAGHKLHIYKLSEGDVLTMSASTMTKLYPLTLAVDNYYRYMRTDSLDVLPASSIRVSSDVFNYYGKFKINLSDTENYKVAIQSFDRTSRTKVDDTSWKTDGYVFTVPMHCCFVAVLAKTDNGRISIDDIPEGLLSIEAVEYASITEVSQADIELLNAKVDAIPTQELLSLSDAVDANKIQALVNLRNTSPIYDHLFVNDTVNAIIPHESLYHLRLSKALGYKIIEANTRATSDGVIVVNHLNNSKFGNYFHHVDGVTDISQIDISSVTWQWIVENVRYNSSTPKYRTRPFRLEEFLAECNRQNMIPFVYSGTTGAIAMADKYMGHYNYICYGGNRTICPHGIIFTWNASSTSKEQILATCDAIGNPMIYGLGNPQDFTDEELLEIVEALHAKGYAISTSYQDANWAKYRAMGFDFNGSQTMINRIEDGNLCNYSSVFGWDDFNLTGNPVNTDDVLTFESAGTITPKLGADTYPICGYDYEIVFDGTISIVTNGKEGTKTYTSDGSAPVYSAFPVFNNSPNIAINVSANTTVHDVYFKAKRFY